MVKRIISGTTYLPIEMTVYVPSTNKKQQKVSEGTMHRRINEVNRFLSKLAGGYTASRASGGYVMGNNILVNENIAKVTSFTTREIFQKKKKIIFARLRAWKKKWGQESIGYEYEGDMYYI